MPGRTYEFVQLDVFTQTPLAGNPLAVFPDAHGLSDTEMQALAREMNLSETTFIFPRDHATEVREGKKVRIFTVEHELPFAGHPTLGTALYLYASDSNQKKPTEIVLDLKAGKIPVRFTANPENAGHDRSGNVHHIAADDRQIGDGSLSQRVADGSGLCGEKLIGRDGNFDRLRDSADLQREVLPNLLRRTQCDLEYLTLKARK